MQQDYLSRRDSLLKARKAKYDAAPDEYRRRRRHFYMEHKSRVDAYSSHYYHAHRLQINERRRLKFKDRNVSSKRGISGINSLVSASSIVEASNLNPQDANTGSSGPINSTASKPSPIPKSISSPHYRVIRHTRNRCLDPNTGKLCEWRPHSQCGAVFGPDMLPQNEGLYSFQRTEFKHWAQLKEGVYSEKSGNTFICRLCQQKALGVSATERERGHAAFCRGNPTGGWNDMDRQMEAFRKINSRPPARDINPSPTKSPLSQYFPPKPKAIKVASHASHAPPRRRTSPRISPRISRGKRKQLSLPSNPKAPKAAKKANPAPVRTGKRKQLSPPSNPKAPKAAKKANPAPKAAQRQRLSRTRPSKTAAPTTKPTKAAKKAHKASTKAKHKAKHKHSVIRRPPRCFGKLLSFEETLLQYSDPQDYEPICTPDGKQLNDEYQIYKEGVPIHLERTAKFLRFVRRQRLNHAVTNSTLTNQEFVAKYSKPVFAAMKAAKTGQPIPSSNPSHFAPLPTWRSRRTKSGRLTLKAEKFQKAALEDLSKATWVLAHAEKKLGFSSSRDKWRQWLRTQYQILMGSIASVRSKDTRLIEFCIVLRFFGFFHIDFVSEPVNIGTMQDLAWWVGCKYCITLESVVSFSLLLAHPFSDNFFSHGPYYWCATSHYIKHCNGGRLPDEKSLIMGLPGCGRKVTALVMQDVWQRSVLLTGDTHVCVGSLAWGFADAPNGRKTMNPTIISRMIEDWMPNRRFRELNSSFAGLRQLYNYEGNADRREEARTVIGQMASKVHMGEKIDRLVFAKESDFFPQDS